MRQISGLLFALLICISVAAGCTSRSGEQGPTLVDRVRIDLDKQEQDDLIKFYVGGMLPQGKDLSWAVSQENGSWLLNQSPSEMPGGPLNDLYAAAGSDNTLDWDEFEPVVRSSYYQARQAPPTVAAFKEMYGDWDGTGWFVHELKGQMSPFRRRMSVSEGNLMEALEDMESLSDSLLYPTGTAIIGEHLADNGIQETTAMVKRVDGYWDYFAYDSTGELALSIAKDPDPLMVPTQCVGCHYGDRAFEPERSFPGSARPGPGGNREMFVPETMKNGSVARALSEHSRRSDHVLGLYGTLYLSKLAQSAKQGAITERESNLLQRLGIEASEQ